MDQDPRIDQILQITKDTNRTIHKMHRSILWGRFFTVVWWLIIVMVSGYTYYVYAQPYVNKLLQVYAQVQQGTAQAQNLQSEVSGFFGNWMQQHPASSSTSTTH